MFSGKLLRDHFASNRLGFVTACFPSSMAAGLIMLLVSLFLMDLTPVRALFVPPVLTIHSHDGDTIDCINRDEQPAFYHPLLRDHEIQEFPTGVAQIEEKPSKKWQVWHETDEDCPPGTIPILRPKGNSTLSSKQYPPRPNDLGTNATFGHMYAIASTPMGEHHFYGTRATLNLWDPVVESPLDFSLAQIWMASGSYKTADLNTIEAGWQVYPGKYGDHQPRLFTYWTANSYNMSGCYGVECSGFVQTNSRIVIGGALRPASIFDGTQHYFTIQMWKDPSSGHWWLSAGDAPIGYWPATIFTTLSDRATYVEWGGEVLYNNISGLNTIAQMGSGEFANKLWRKAAYFCNLEVAENNNTLLPVQTFGVRETNPDYYTVKKYYNKECGIHFYYGGPGPLRSEAGRLISSLSRFLVIYVFYILVVVN